MPPLLAPPPCPPSSSPARGDGADAALLDDSTSAAPARAPRPRELNTRTCGAFLAVAKDKLSVRYEGAGAHGNDVGAAHADAPVPPDVAVYYFELSVLSPGARGTLGLGFSDKSFKTSRQPGCAAGGGSAAGANRARP